MSAFYEWNVEDEMPLAVFMGDERNRASFLNPVMACPWRSLMPVGCSLKSTNYRAPRAYEEEAIIISCTKRNSNGRVSKKVWMVGQRFL